MHENSIHLTPEATEALIRGQFPEWDDEPLQWLGDAGTVNWVVRIGEHLAARFQRQFGNLEEVSENLQHEAEALERLSAAVSVPVPAVVALGEPGPQYPLPWTVHTWVAGEVVTPTSVAAAQPFSEGLLTLISELRGTDAKGRQFRGSGRGGELTFHDEWMETCFRESERLLDVPSLRRLWERFRELPRDQPDGMTHGDLIPANILIDNGQLCGLLDGGGFGPADPALDLVSAWHLFDSPLRAHFRRHLGCSDVEWQRGAAWAFQQSMGLVWYYNESHPGMRELGRSTLHRIQSDPEISG